MTLAATASRRFAEEFSLMLDRSVRVVTSPGEIYEGKLVAYSPADHSLWLSDVRDKSGKAYIKLFVSGSSVSTVEVLEIGPDLQKLADRINRLFPNMVSYVKEANVIIVMDRIRVTEEGVAEGTGPAAEKVQKIYDEFMSEEAKKTES